MAVGLAHSRHPVEVVTDRRHQEEVRVGMEVLRLQTRRIREQRERRIIGETQEDLHLIGNIIFVNFSYSDT